jgi:hypothetical protein
MSKSGIPRIAVCHGLAADDSAESESALEELNLVIDGAIKAMANNANNVLRMGLLLSIVLRNG